MKEFLSRNGIDFKGRDVEKDPGALEEMRSMGFTSAPVTVIGDKRLIGFNRRELSAALKLAPVDEAAFDSTAAALFPRVLDAVARAVRQVPDDRLDSKSPDRDRSVREFAYHIFRYTELAIGAVSSGKFDNKPFARYREESQQFRTAEGIARYGDKVRAKLRDCLSHLVPEQLRSPIDAYSGPTSASALLLQVLEHTAHHVRQLYAVLETFGVPPAQPLTAGDFSGLRLPSQLW